MEPKPWWKSRMVWLGAATFLLGGLEMIRDIVPAEWLPILTTLIGVLTVVLRLDTRQPIR